MGSNSQPARVDPITTAFCPANLCPAGRARKRAVPAAMLHGNLITFSTYASHVQGDHRGSSRYRQGYQAPNEALRAGHLARAHGVTVSFDESDRTIVVSSFVEVCSHRAWTLCAAHVRTEHVHVVIVGAASPHDIMRDLKAYSSRRLHEAERFNRQKIWARRSDIRRLDFDRALAAAKVYVVERQGTVVGCVGFATGTAR